MPTNDPIAAARREAKTRARKGGVTHQQALDAIAREAGHANWAEMAKRTPDDILAFVERLRPHGGIPMDETTQVLTYDAIHGYLAEPEGTDIAAFVDAYDFRGDDGDISPNAFQRDIIENAIDGYMRELRGPGGDDAPKRGPNIFLPPQLYDFPYLKGPGQPQDDEPPADIAAMLHKPTLADVERDVKRIMERQRASGAEGMTISQWVSSRMRDAAGKGMANAGDPMASLAELPMTTDTVAYAMDPSGGPYDDVPKVTVHCPVHGRDGGDRHASLVIAGMGMACMAGCDADALSAHLTERLCDAARRARTFMERNDRSPVHEGSSNSSRGGMGGTYRLADGSSHRMDTLTCRMLPDGYPKWEYGTG